MPGTKNMIAGALWAVGGTLVTVVTYSATSGGGTYVVAYGAIIFGGIQFVIGLFQYLGHQPQEGGKQEASSQAILGAMITTAAADHEIEDNEIDMIAGIYEQVFGNTLDKGWIKDIAEQMLRDDFDVYDAISNEMSIIDPDIVPLIFRASYLVAAADGTVDENEWEILTEIAEALDMNEVDIEDNLWDLQNR